MKLRVWNPIETSEGYDIIDTKNNIELGSYGIRKHDELE
jgi:hypothetical protein